MRQEEIDAIKAGIDVDDLRVICARCGRWVKESEAVRNWPDWALQYECRDRSACDKAKDAK